MIKIIFCSPRVNIVLKTLLIHRLHFCACCSVLKSEIHFSCKDCFLKKPFRKINLVHEAFGKFQ